MPDNPEVKVVLTAEDQGVASAIRQLNEELKGLTSRQNETGASARKLTGSFKDMVAQMLGATKLRIANIPGLGGFGNSLALRAYEPVGKMLEEGAGDLEEKFGGAALAIGGVTAGIVALGAVAAGVTRHMMDLAQSIENTAAATGLSTVQVQEYTELAKEMGVDAQSLQMAFARIQTQLGEFVSTGKAAGNGSQYFVRVMKEMNVSLTDAQGKLRPVNDIIGDFADKLSQIPDAETRAALEMAALGTRGRVLAQVMEEASREGLSLRDTLASIDKSGNVIPDSQLDNLMQAKHAWDELARSIRGAMTVFEGFIAEAVTHPLKGATALVFSWMTGGNPAETLNAMMPVAKSQASAGSSGNPLLVAQIAAANEKLQERVDVLRAGGEAQLQLKQAEAGYAAAVKSHNAVLAEQYKTQITDLQSIISLEAAKKHHRGQGPRLAPEEAAKAELALALKQQQDLLNVWKASAQAREDVEKQEYENGTISIEKYFADRRSAIQTETAKEIAVLKQERDQVQAAANLAGERAASAKMSLGALGAKARPEDRNALAGQADRETAEQLNGLARVDELSTRISEAEIASRAKLTVIDAEQFKTEVEQKKKILEFLHQIQELQGNATEGAKAEVEAKIAEMRVALDQMKGQNVGGVKLDSAGIDQLITKYRELKAAVAGFGDAQHDVEQGMRQLELDRTGIDERVKTGQITQMQAERAYMNIVQQEIPLLERKAQVELSEAVKTGDQGRIQQAQQTMQQIRALEISVTQLGQKWKQTFNQSLSQTFDQFASRLTSGTKGIVQSFASLEMAVVGSLEHVAAQMLANALTQKAISEGTKLDDAKTAAANVYAQVSGIPVIGWILAPVAAAAAFAAVLAFEKGGIVPGRAGEAVPILAHANEMVLPADISTGMRSMIETGMPQPRGIASLHDFSRPSFDLPENIAAGAARNQFTRNEYHLHHNGPDALEVLQTQLVPMIKEALRAGSLDDVAP